MKTLPLRVIYTFPHTLQNPQKSQSQFDQQLSSILQEFLPFPAMTKKNSVEASSYRHYYRNERVHITNEELAGKQHINIKHSGGLIPIPRHQPFTLSIK